MRFCMRHWDNLRLAVEDTGLYALVSEGGEEALKKVVSELTEGSSIDNFDPLMQAHNAILANAMRILVEVGDNPLVLLTGDDDDKPDHEACPICRLNFVSDEHDRVCINPECDKEPGMTFDWMVERAASDALEHWKELGSGV